MTDAVSKVHAKEAPQGEMGQKYLASGDKVGLRMWVNEPPNEEKQLSVRDYETVGYVLAGRALLHLEDRQVPLNPGDSWVVPQGTLHHYEIFEPLTAIEATSPPARHGGRDRL